MRHSPQIWTSEALISHSFGPLRWIIDDLLPVGGIGLMYGKRGCGKSNLAFTLLCNILDSEPFLGHHRCQATKMMYLSVDMPEQAVQERVQKAFPDAPDRILWALHSAPFDIMAESENAAWLLAARRFAPSLVVVDTSRKCHLMDENVSTTPTVLYKRLKELFPEGTTFLILHHDNKTVPKFQAPEDESFSGSGAWINGADLGIYLRRIVNKLAPKELVHQANIARYRFTEAPEGNRMRLNAKRMVMEVDD